MVGNDVYQLTEPYRKPVGPNSASLSRKSYTLGHQGGYGRPHHRSRNMSGDVRPTLDYVSDTEAVQSPPRSMRTSRLRSGSFHTRSNSLPRTFNREALLRHPELSMELDRLSAPEDNLSETGESRLGIRHTARGDYSVEYGSMGDHYKEKYICMIITASNTSLTL